MNQCPSKSLYNFFQVSIIKNVSLRIPISFKIFLSRLVKVFSGLSKEHEDGLKNLELSSLRTPTTQPQPQLTLQITVTDFQGNPLNDILVRIKACPSVGNVPSISPPNADGHPHDSQSVNPNGRLNNCEQGRGTSTRPISMLDNQAQDVTGNTIEGITRRTAQNGEITVTYSPPHYSTRGTNHYIAGVDAIYASLVGRPNIMRSKVNS